MNAAPPLVHEVRWDRALRHPRAVLFTLMGRVRPSTPDVVSVAPGAVIKRAQVLCLATTEVINLIKLRFPSFSS